MSVLLQTSEQNQLLSLNMQCQRFIGDAMYVFYEPLSRGDFVVNCWLVQKVRRTEFSESSMSNTEENYEPHWGMLVYEDGEVLDPSQDERFCSLVWASQENGFWSERTFTKSQIQSILRDIVLHTE
eukprot:TRINITY_DN8389_c0_g1_i1.p1 TRINITY_DN8389_c0_g1~~TRINITY_DN8389_c0_g1_i1.p1  ORF type:complete len:126 (+),score=19.37 TRINITY_DN8389_c0_g1_i1:94-471(+)